MYRSFDERMRQMLEEREGAYPRRYVTDRATTQMAHSFSNPSGECAHLAIGAAASSEAP